jgi:hypothetical protein
VSQDIDGKRRFKIPTLINGSIIMDKDGTLQQSHGRSIITKNSTSTESTKSACKMQHKVLILGNIHLRGSDVILSSELSPQLKVFGVIRPGAGAEKIVNSFAEYLQNYHSHDVVLHAGANDVRVYKNKKGVALTQITKFIQRNYGTNIIILDIPQRYDLSSFLCVNSEIGEFNGKLKSIASLYNHVSLLETNLKRDCFTKHGLHWNSLGKTLVVKLISLQINKLAGKGRLTLISLTWIDNALLGTTDSWSEEMITLSGDVNVSMESENIRKNEQRKQQKDTGTEEINLCRTSARQRKVPVTRSEDFLW